MIRKKRIILLALSTVLICAIAITTYFILAERVSETDQYFLDVMPAKIYSGADGKELRYRVYIPQNYDQSQKYPLVLYLHGKGTWGTNNRDQIIENDLLRTLLTGENLTKYPCIVLAPQAPKNQRWVHGPDDMPNNSAALMGLLEQMCTVYSVDPARVYITGVSMGGFGTWGMLRAYPNYFAAAVPVCGGWDLDDDVALAPNLKDIPIWAFHGDKDTAVPVERSRDMVDALKAAGSKVIRYTEYPGMEHSISEIVYGEAELLPWMFEQIRDN